MKIWKTLTFSSIFAISACSSTATKQDDHSIGMKDAFRDSFTIGAAINKAQIYQQEAGTTQVIQKHFNTLTAENEMKWEAMQPREGQFNFDVSDTLVAFSEQNDIFLVGHTLLWHHQTPEWVFQNDKGQPASRDLLLSRLKTHIDTVAGRYKGRIQGWDVVNEALNEDGSWRESPWYKILGDDYIHKAFEFAAAAAPNAELYYNDYNLFKPEKRDGAVKIVKSLQAKGLRIDGIGIQGHYGIGYPDLTQLEDSIKAFSALDVDVMITELDVSVLPFPEAENQGADISIDLALQERLNPYPNGMDAEISKQFSDHYLDLFKLFLKYKSSISRITFWGVNDGQTWRNDWPMKGRTDYPLMFDRNNQAKQVLLDLVEYKKSLAK